MKILIVDDHPLIREALRHVLPGLAADIRLYDASDLESGLALADQHPDLDLALLDLTLPGCSGMSALRTFRSAQPALPIVVLSGFDDTDTVISSLDEGAMGFIPKSSSNEVLLGALRLVLSGGVYVPRQAIAGEYGLGAPRRDDAPRKPQTASDIGLTERQSEVLTLMVQGMPNKEICRELNLAEGTVKVHITAILKALGATNRTQAVVAASRIGLKLGPSGGTQ
ncbi:response regulator transcription factor [Methyloversatilis sp.]|jgi:DNA-binding NarL/FixJ family response regulator|uniref:response regulator n=1 Tax=Methyloversatilis sp. TaxID=2569862 RepID=UPI0027363356|nr:response regulator transcription factor [Methyloversatilis sp.]MDP2870143.1 response regulator transcription factor [Methyloversatilis sp.]MDP3287578.1 response regulator transcription factor [Methyloversatilis sp.]MDP3454489.1 response regulator transcription factor [Methyloversatilis sp.]MDP3578948.1 response regulator transcription factor [Methyloversatilis sp.]